MRVIERLTGSARFVADARRFLQDEITPEEARAEIERRLAGRAQSFLHVMEAGAYSRPKSLYARLLEEVKVSFDDLRRLVDQAGVEGALERLYDAGVYVTNDEMKGREPLKRGSLEILAEASDFANPFTTNATIEVESSGSTGKPAPTAVNHASWYEDALSVAMSLQTHGVRQRPTACLSVAGLERLFLLWYAKAGLPMERCFNVLNADGLLRGQSRASALAKLQASATLLLKRKRLVSPNFSLRSQVDDAADWLAAKRQAGTPALLRTFASPAVRVCLSAARRDLDISGSTIRLGGEPYTAGKAKVLASAGVRAIGVYVSIEMGEIADQCATPSTLDDLHFLSDRAAVIQRDVRNRSGSYSTLIFSTLVPTSRKLLLNYVSDDYATLEQRDCGCMHGEVGLKTHLSGIHSDNKLTSEGVTFSSTSLYELVDHVLPARFGGSPTDYQLVEQEDGGVPTVRVRVSPSLGMVDEGALLQTVAQSLSESDSSAPVWMALWSEQGTLSVGREEPLRTANGKVMPLHIVRPDA